MYSVYSTSQKVEKKDYGIKYLGWNSTICGCILASDKPLYETACTTDGQGLICVRVWVMSGGKRRGRSGSIQRWVKFV